MSNRVIKDSIWTSPTLAKLSISGQLHWPRWLLMADDWGCFNVDPDVIQGLVYPKMKGMTVKKIQDLVDEYNKAGLLFIWEAEDRTWGYFVSWDSHHSYCNKTNVDSDGKNQKHRRKTPEPPKQELEGYLKKSSTISTIGTQNKKVLDNKELGGLGHLGTSSDKILIPIPNPIPNPNPKTSPKNDKYGPTSQEARLASYLFKKILGRNPSHKQPDLGSWAAVVDKMIRLDKRDPTTIKEVIDWCQKDSFWQTNILSAAKLRAQFDQLTIKMKSAGGQSISATPPKKACKDCGTTKWTAFTAGRCEGCYQEDLKKY